MKIEEIKHPELKNHINMIYMHGENENQIHQRQGIHHFH